MSKPHIDDLFDAVSAHRTRIAGILRDARIKDIPEFEREAQGELRVKLREWGIEDAFTYERDR